MDIKHIAVRNFIGLVEASLSITKPINLFIGENGSGKSSLASVFEYTATGTARSISLKKDRGRLIRRGSGKAEAALTLANDVTLRRTTTASGESFRATIDNKSFGEFPFDFNTTALNPFLFFEKSIEERKAMLYRLVAGGSHDVNVIMDELFKRGVPDQTTKEIALQVIEHGFAATQADVIEERKSLKREREALKESAAFDPVLNAGWTIDGADYTLTDYTVEQLNEALEALEAAKSGLLIEKGKISNAVAKSEVKAELEQVVTDLTLAETEQAELKDPAALKAKASEISATFDKLQTDIMAAQATKKLMVENLNLQIPNFDFDKCPVMEGIKCPVSDKDRKKPKTIFEERKARAQKATDDANAEIADLMKQRQTKSEEYSELAERIDEMESAIETAREKVMSLRMLKPTLEEKLDTAVDVVGDTVKLDEEINELTYRASVGRQLIRAVENYHTQKAAFDKAGPAIAEKDEAIKSCDILDKALSPNGIPAELTQDAMGAFKARIQQTSKIFGVLVDVNPDDFLPLWNGNHYNLLSESEQWRARVIFQESIAFLAKTPWLILDSADILDFNNRDRLFDLILDIASGYDFVAIFATQNTETIPVIEHSEIDFWRVHEGRVTLLKPATAQAA
jgi:hypothetical protein